MKLFIFGSTGDLVKRKVLPGLRELDEDLNIYALGRKDFTDNIYKDFVCEGMCSLRFRKRLYYHKLDFDKEDLCNSCLELFDKDKINFIYISLPPKNILNILKTFFKIKEKFKFKFLIEKPFGENLKSAQDLKNLIRKNNSENDVFLSDHYLFKQGVRELNFKNFKKIEIVSTEEVGLEGRAGYYDNVGALKDMIQSHFFNLIFKIVDNNKLENLVVKKILRGQYETYTKELGKNSKTETAIYLKMSDGKSSLEFLTGKKFAQKESWIKVDGEKLILKNSGEYKTIFSEFFKGNKKYFPTIDNAVSSWKIIEDINQEICKLIIYPNNTKKEVFKNEI